MHFFCLACDGLHGPQPWLLKFFGPLSKLDLIPIVGDGHMNCIPFSFKLLAAACLAKLMFL